MGVPYASIDLSAVLRVLIVALGCVLWTAETRAHGNVVAEEDVCLIKIGFYSAHFSVYQPRTGRHFEFCEDLPEVTETVFVLNYLHDSMRTVPVDFRIVSDSLGLGRFARWEDLARMDLEQDTVIYVPPRTQADGVLTVLHEFAVPGDYIGVVTAANPQQDKIYRAVFPFRVGGFGWPGWLLVIVLVTGILSATAWLLGPKYLHARRGAAPACVLAGLLLLATPADVRSTELVSSQAGHFHARFEAVETDVDINRMHSWIVHIVHSSGAEVEGARIRIGGGMPEHDHGLPTAPRMTRDLGGGNYLVEGFRFHMNGHWQVMLTVTTDKVEDVVVFDLEL